MTFAELENEALEPEAPSHASDTLSIAWANVSPLVPDCDVDADAFKALRDLLASNEDVDTSTRQWLQAHGV